MIIRTSLSVLNQVHKASLTVEANSRELSYIRAYGEPLISLTGTIPYTPEGTPTPEPQIDLDTDADIGSPPVAGSATINAGIDGLEVRGSGVFPTSLNDTIGFVHYALEVTGDFELTARLVSFSGGAYGAGEDPTLQDGFLAGLWMANAADSDAAGYLFGWGAHNSAYKIAFWRRATLGTGYSEVASLARPNPVGILLKLVRTDTSLTASYSVNEGETWTAIGATTIEGDTWRAGLFVNSGKTTEALALFDRVSLSPTAGASDDTFFISGTRQAYIRTNAPHEYTLDAKTVDEAKAKIAGWATTIADRIEAAKVALMLNPVPPAEGQVEIREV